MSVLRDDAHLLEEPANLGGILREVLRRLAPAAPADPTVSLVQITEHWRSVLGDELAGMTRVLRYREGVLTVEVGSAPLLSELKGFARDHLLAELAGRGVLGLHDIRFRSVAVHGAS